MCEASSVTTRRRLLDLGKSAVVPASVGHVQCINVQGWYKMRFSETLPASPRSRPGRLEQVATHASF